jgi:hypothetical protein
MGTCPACDAATVTRCCRLYCSRCNLLIESCSDVGPYPTPDGLDTKADRRNRAALTPRERGEESANWADSADPPISAEGRYHRFGYIPPMRQKKG